MLKPQIALEEKIRKQIYNALQGKYLEKIIRKLNSTSSENYWQSRMEGHSFKIEPEIMPKLYEIFDGVKTGLGYKRQVDFYVSSDSEVNAFSVMARVPSEPDIINVNSALIDLMTEDELRFVIGHEFGHLINKDTNLSDLVYFVFPPDKAAIPLILVYKFRLWQQLCELTADRYGYLAIPDLNTCVSAFYKMASGLHLTKDNFDLDLFIKNNLKHLDYFVKDKGMNLFDHPVNPVRIQSLNLYATASSQKALSSGMEGIATALLKVFNGEEGKYLAQFIASAGLLVASADNEVSEEEWETILNNLSQLEIFPREYLMAISKMPPEEIVKMFNGSVMKLMKINPGLRDTLFEYVIGLVLADKKIDDPEMKLMHDVGTFLQYSDREIAETFAQMVQLNFVPSFDAMG